MSGSVDPQLTVFQARILEALDRDARRGDVGMTSEQIALETDEIKYWTERRLVEIEVEGLVSRARGDCDAPPACEAWKLTEDGARVWRLHLAFVAWARREEEEAADRAARLSEQEAQDDLAEGG